MFKKYLANKGLIRKFEANLVNHYLGGSKPNPDHKDWFELRSENYNAISSAFSWGITPEGGDFWVNLNYKWQKYLASKSI